MSHFGYLWKVVHNHKRAGSSGRGPKCGVGSESLCSKGDLVGTSCASPEPSRCRCQNSKVHPWGKSSKIAHLQGCHLGQVSLSEVAGYFNDRH